MLKHYTSISNDLTTEGMVRNRNKGQQKYLVSFVILCQTLSIISICVTFGELQHRISTFSVTVRIHTHVTLVVFLCTDFIRYITPKIEQSLNVIWSCFTEFPLT